MNKICLVTYTRDEEYFTDELIEIGNMLSSNHKCFKCIVFVEKKLKFSDKIKFKIEQKYMEGTKYKKLIKLMEEDTSDFFISIDNDIKGNIKKLKKFMLEIVNSDYDIGWGKIIAIPEKDLISKLVSIDKILSHYLIRPILWKMGIGISIPGQCFVIKRQIFKGKLLEIDTFLDDLALGLYLNINKRQISSYYSSEVLGYEKPNTTFNGLLRQRSRWAEGYRTIISGVKTLKEKNLIILHGIAYHTLWIINWGAVLALIYFTNVWNALIYMLIIGILITFGNLRIIGYSIIYQLIFPIFHLKWLWCLFFKSNKS